LNEASALKKQIAEDQKDVRTSDEKRIAKYCDFFAAEVMQIFTAPTSTKAKWARFQRETMSLLHRFQVCLRTDI
jgi:hypothetical protein